jgi:hypothetical protein
MARAPLTASITRPCHNDSDQSGVTFTCQTSGTAPSDPVVHYSQGQNGPNGTDWSQFYGNRTYNRVWHQASTEFGLYYCLDMDGCTSVLYAAGANPIVDTRNSNPAQSYCINVNDTSGVVWTCETSAS